ncbi:Translocation protein SEC62, partial [Clarias magur]
MVNLAYIQVKAITFKSPKNLTISSETMAFLNEVVSEEEVAVRVERPPTPYPLIPDIPVIPDEIEFEDIRRDAELSVSGASSVRHESDVEEDFHLDYHAADEGHGINEALDDFRYQINAASPETSQGPIPPPPDFFYDLNQSLIMLNDILVNLFDPTVNISQNSVSDVRNVQIDVDEDNVTFPGVRNVQIEVDEDNVTFPDVRNVQIDVDEDNVTSPDVRNVQIDVDEDNVTSPDVRNVQIDVDEDNVTSPDVRNVQIDVDEDNVTSPDVQNAQFGNGLDPNIRVRQIRLSPFAPVFLVAT